MSDEETRVVIRADEEGFAEVSQQAGQLAERLGNKPDGVATAVGQLDERLKALDQTLRRAGSSMARIDARAQALGGNLTGLVAKLASVGGQLPSALGGAAAGGGQVSPAGAGATGSPGGAAHPLPGAAGGGVAPPPARGPGPKPPGMGSRLLQGFLQGSGGPQFLPHGQGWGGMVAQTAGNAMGTFGRGALSAPFTGLGGLTTAMSAIPGGGVVGGLLQSGVAASQSAVALQQQTLGLGAALVDPEAIAAARASAGAAAGAAMGPEGEAAYAERAASRGYSSSFNAASQAAARRSATTDVLSQQGGGMYDYQRAALLKQGKVDPRTIEQAAEAGAEAARQAAQAEYGVLRSKAIDQAGAAGAQAAMGLSALDASGVNLAAMDAGQARGFAGGVLARGGGTLGAAQSSGFLDAALSAQTLYGVGPEASGGVLAGQRYGGLQGVGQGGAGLAGIIAQALAAGVDKSNMAEAIQDIASQQGQYAATGLAADPSSYFAGAGALNRLGISDPRARGIAGQMRDKGRGIATGGLSNSTDYAMLTTLGGFRPGGSEDELGAALERMETGGDLSKIPDLLRMASDASGGGLAGRIAASQVGGVPLSEARRILAGEVDPAAAAAQDAAKRSGMTVDQLTGAAARQVDTYGSGARTSAALSNERAATGANFIQTAANLERAQLASTRAIGAFNTQLDSLTSAVLTVSRAIERAANGLAEVGRTR